MRRIRRVIIAAILVFAWSTRFVAASPGNGQAQTDPHTTSKNSDAGSLHQVYGTVRSIAGSQLTIEAREHRTVQVDASAAIRSYRTVVLTVGRAVNVSGSYDAKGVLHAQAIQRAKSSPAGWPSDR